MDEDDLCEVEDEPTDPEEDWWDQKAEECGLGSDGYCMLAGTEHCDFECPFRDDECFKC